MSLQKPSFWLKAGYLSFTILLWAIFIAPAQAAVELRVAIKKNVNQLKVGSSTEAVVKNGMGKPIGLIEPMASLFAYTNNRGISLNQTKAPQIIIEPKQDGYVWIGDRWYRGKVKLIRQANGIIAVNQVNLEDYLYSVVGAEAIASWPQEALKAQAVAARTYALHKKATSNSKLYDLDTTTNTQVYKGLDSEYTTTHQAVEGTKGQIMTYHNKVILAVFHSSSGGHTENVEDIWNSSLPYLRGVVDYDQTSPVYQWTKTFSQAELTERLGKKIGEIKALIPQKTTPQGRVISMTVVGTNGTTTITGKQIRKALDLKSSLFTIANFAGVFRVQGRGFGHGVGLSQWGAYFLAKEGVNYQTILNHYYQNALISRIN